jgi:methyl-accepting chemotaxis protein
MKLGHKLLLAPVLTALAVLAAGQLDAWFINRSAEQSHAAFATQLEDYTTVNDVQDQVSAVQVDLYRTMAIVGSMDDDKVKAYRAQLAQQVTGVDRVLGQLSGPGLDAASIDKASGLLKQFLKQADAAVDLASVDPNTGVAALQTADATFQTLAKQLKQISKGDQQYFEAQSNQSREQASKSHLLLAMLSVLVAAAAIALSWIVLRRVAANLAKASEVAQGVASGDLQMRIDAQGDDELGQLLGALSHMQSSLSKVVGDIRHSSESIGVASNEIASGTQDLANRTEAAASNLEETASSMEELTATVKQSADAARQANQLASTAAEVASRGGQVVNQVVATMEDINHSSKKIADIIGVIDGIAFQTNILALNAAVEAARAGEQGRGFAVVAGEVRSLAQRSAQAAKEIKDLIGASVDKVQAGSQLVQDAGQTMGEIVSSVQRVTDIIGEITAAASEQSDGIAQVNTAINQLDQMTQQNAALVEQSTAAAESLKDQAQRLTQVVSVFKVAGGHASHASAPLKPQSSRPTASSLAHKQIASSATAVSVGGRKITKLAAPTPSSAKPAQASAAPAARMAAPKVPASAKAPAAEPRQTALKRPSLAGAGASAAPAAAPATSSTRVVRAPAADDGDWETF